MPFRSSFFMCGLAVALGGACLLASAHAAETQTTHTFERTLTKKARYEYLLSLPAGYNAQNEKRWPLLLFLHGSGERGSDIWQVAKHGPPKLLRAGADDPATKQLAGNFIVVSPQCPHGVWWDPEAVLALLDDILATHQVDPTRVYLTGLSMGGFGTWDLAMAHPERFAAIVPICGGGPFGATYLSNLNHKDELRSLGVWAFHGGQDKTVPPAESERMIDLLKHFQVADVNLTIYPEAAHDSWTATYANPEVYTWLLKHARKPAEAVK